MILRGCTFAAECIGGEPLRLASLDAATLHQWASSNLKSPPAACLLYRELLLMVVPAALYE